MKIGFYYPRSIEQWQPDAPDTVGIGCSETALVEVARRLAERGHEVAVYSSCEACEDRGVAWRPYQSFPVGSKADVWISHRCADTPRLAPGGRHYLWAQDIDAVGLTPENQASFEAVLVMCREQAAFIEAQHPGVRTIMTSNATRTDLIDEIDWMITPVKKPHRIMFASSPDRGLVNLLRIFQRVREHVPDAELHAFYGFDNMEKMAWFPGYKELRATIESAEKGLPGFVYHGRVGQRQLYEEWLTSGLWVHPSDFTETSCETCMAAQATGAIPVTRPIWAIADNVRYGAFVRGSAAEPLSIQEYVAWTLRLMQDEALAERIRAAMVPWARRVFTWDRVVDQWEEDILQTRPHRERGTVIADWPIEPRPDHTPYVPPEAPPAMLGRKVLGTIAYCQKDWMVTPRSWSKCARDLAVFTTRCLNGGEDVYWLEEAGTDHAQVRNAIAAKFEGDWVLQLDCDHTFEPDAAIRLLRAFNARMPDGDSIDVLTGIYYHRQPPHVPQLYLWNEEVGAFVALRSWPQNKLVTAPGLAAGGGCLLVRRSVFERLGERPFDRMLPDGELRRPLSEDLSFFRRCHRAGIKVWAHPGVLCGHIIERIVGPADFVPFGPEIPVALRGVQVAEEKQP